MPPATNRLASLDPGAVGRATARRAYDRLAMLSVQLQPAMPPLPSLPDERLGETQIALTVADLVRYAQTGDGDAEDVREQVQDIAVAVGPMRLAADPNDDLELAVMAAQARAILAEGSPADAGLLGALAGVASHHVRLLGRRGEIDITSAADQRRWLAARGVPGFETKRRR